MDKRLIAIGLLFFVNVLGFAVLIPVLPFVVEQFGASDIMYGVLLSAYPFFQFIGAPMLGTLSDHYGRRPILIISQAGTLLSWVIFGITYFTPHLAVGVTTLPMIILIISRVADGITGGNFSVANAYISEITERSDRTKIFGMLGGIVGSGLILGPVIGGMLMSLPLGYFAVTIFAFSVSLLTLILMHFFLPETLDEKHRVKELDFHVLREINIIGKINQFQRPVMRRLFFTRAFFALTFSSYTSVIVLFMRDGFGLSPSQVGLLFLVLGMFFIVNQSFVTPFLSRKYGELSTFYIGQICMIIGLVSISLVPNVWVFMPVAYIANLGFSSSFPTFKTVITDLVDKSRQGAVTGVDESVLAGASAIAPLTASVIYAGTAQWAFALFALFAVIPFITMYARTGKPVIEIPVDNHHAS